MAIHGTAEAVSTARQRATCGERTPANRSASLRSRVRASSPAPGGSVLRATARPAASKARKTSPIPPDPSRPCSWKGPIVRGSLGRSIVRGTWTSSPTAWLRRWSAQPGSESVRHLGEALGRIRIAPSAERNRERQPLERQDVDERRIPLLDMRHLQSKLRMLLRGRGYDDEFGGCRGEPIDNGRHEFSARSI